MILNAPEELLAVYFHLTFNACLVRSLVLYNHYNVCVSLCCHRDAVNMSCDVRAAWLDILSEPVHEGERYKLSHHQLNLRACCLCHQSID